MIPKEQLKLIGSGYITGNQTFIHSYAAWPERVSPSSSPGNINELAGEANQYQKRHDSTDNGKNKRNSTPATRNKG